LTKNGLFLGLNFPLIPISGHLLIGTRIIQKKFSSLQQQSLNIVLDEYKQSNTYESKQIKNYENYELQNPKNTCGIHFYGV